MSTKLSAKPVLGLFMISLAVHCWLQADNMNMTHSCQVNTNPSRQATQTFQSILNRKTLRAVDYSYASDSSLTQIPFLWSAALWFQQNIPSL